MTREKAYEMDRLIADLREAGSALMQLDQIILEAREDRDHLQRQTEAAVRSITNCVNEKLDKLSELFGEDAWPFLMAGLPAARQKSADDNPPVKLAA